MDLYPTAPEIAQSRANIVVLILNTDRTTRDFSRDFVKIGSPSDGCRLKSICCALSRERCCGWAHILDAKLFGSEQIRLEYSALLPTNKCKLADGDNPRGCLEKSEIRNQKSEKKSEKKSEIPAVRVSPVETKQTAPRQTGTRSDSQGSYVSQDRQDTAHAQSQTQTQIDNLEKTLISRNTFHVGISQHLRTRAHP